MIKIPRILAITTDKNYCSSQGHKHWEQERFHFDPSKQTHQQTNNTLLPLLASKGTRGCKCKNINPITIYEKQGPFDR